VKPEEYGSTLTFTEVYSHLVCKEGSREQITEKRERTLH
jgi:hypothetical protein